MYYGVKLTLSTTTSKLPATGWPKCTMYWIIPVCGFFIIYFTGSPKIKKPRIMLKMMPE
jgi:TRAP-type C4-dicarboxylate transport system permease small subunit